MRTAPLTTRRLGALVAIGAVLLFGAGAVGGGIAKRRSLFAFDGVVWGRDAVVVRADEGSDAVAAVIALVITAAMVAVAFGVWVLVQRTVRPVPPARTRWLAGLGGGVVLGIVGLAIGWATTSTDDGVTASSVATYLLDQGADVGADLPTGYVPAPRVSGTRQVVLPARVEYQADGTPCSVAIVDQNVPVVDGQITLTPLCG